MGKRTLLKDIFEKETTMEEVQEYKILKRHKGWQLYMNRMDELFDYNYNSLRKIKKDVEYYKLQGKLDGIEACISLIDELIASHEVAHSQSS